MKRTRSLIALLSLAALSAASAQTPTSGTLASQVSSNWTTAPWMITAGPGTFPDGGGTATFNTAINNVLGTVAGGIALTLDVPITLSGLTYNTPYTQNIAGTNSLILANSGAIFNVQLSGQNTPSLFTLTNVISAPVSGGGSFGLTKTGSGILTLTGANTYTGGTRINGGTIALSGANGDALLGATGAGNGIFFDGGILLNNATAFTTARDIFLGAGGGTLRLFTGLTVNGIISGSGSLRRELGSGAVLALTGANTYTGTTTQTVGVITVSGANGTIATSSGYDLAGTLNLDNSQFNNNNRISDTAAITSRGATITLTGNASAATSELAGALNLTNGNTTLTVTPNASQAASLNFNSINRQNNSTLFVRGTSLGSAPAAGVGTITSVNAPGALIGGGGAAGSTTQSILPFAVGNTSASTTLGSTHVTYDSIGGNVRPLLTTEYATTLGTNSTDNVRLTASTAAPDSTANALLFAPAVAATLSGGTINITSGSFLYSPTVSSIGTVSANLNFGAAEGFIHTSATLGISGVISGSGGLTINPFNGSTVTLSGANTYTGITTLNGGTTAFGGTVASGAPSAFGSSTSAIVMNLGTASTLLYGNAVGSVLNRDLVVSGNPSPNVLAELGVTGTQDLTMNGNILLNRTLSIGGSSTPITLNGVVSGVGGLTERFSSLVVLNANNTFSGGINIQTGTFAAGVNSTATSGAFGTGTIFFSGAGGGIRSSDSTARTIANNIFIGSALSATATSNPTFSGTGALTFTGNVDLNGSRGLNVTNTALTTFAGNVGNGSLTKFGTGSLALTNPGGNTYNGGTVVNAGALIVNNTSGSGTGAGTVSIVSGATLSGAFSISGFTQIAGNFTVGGSGATATDNFNASLTLTSTAVTSFELASASSFDHVNVANLLTLAGTINVVTINGFIAQAGQSFDLLDWGNLNASGFSLANLNLSGAQTAPGTFFDTSTFLTNGTITVVPEPSTYALLVSGLGMAGVALRRRFRASRA